MTDVRRLSRPEPSPGVFYLVPTPIGNLGDFSPRAKKVLAEVDHICCEDTRTTRGLLDRAGVSTGAKLSAFHEHSGQAAVEQAIGWLAADRSVAIVSDAGTPACSDPGYELVTAVVSAGYTLVSLPGPSALIAALVGSGLPTDAFHFAGFLPSKSGKRSGKLTELKQTRATLIFYEAPTRVVAMLKDVAETLGDRPVCVARELSKLHEEFIRGSAHEVVATLEGRDRVRGECVVVVGGFREEPSAAHAMSAETLCTEMLAQGIHPKKIKAVVAKVCGLPKKDVFAMMERAKSR